VLLQLVVRSKVRSKDMRWRTWRVKGGTVYGVKTMAEAFPCIIPTEQIFNCRTRTRTNIYSGG
jgi:hypothetical protein